MAERTANLDDLLAQETIGAIDQMSLGDLVRTKQELLGEGSAFLDPRHEHRAAAQKVWMRVIERMSQLDGSDERERTLLIDPGTGEEVTIPHMGDQEARDFAAEMSANLIKGGNEIEGGVVGRAVAAVDLADQDREIGEIKARNAAAAAAEQAKAEQAHVDELAALAERARQAHASGDFDRHRELFNQREAKIVAHRTERAASEKSIQTKQVKDHLGQVAENDKLANERALAFNQARFRSG